MAGPWEKYQSQQPAEGPWSKYQAAPAAPEQPAGPSPAELAGQRSAANAPGAQVLRAGNEGPSVASLLREQGVGFQEAPFGAQFDVGLGAPRAETPEQKVELARRALRVTPDRVRFDPGTEQVLYLPEGSQQWQTFNAPGPSLGDVTRFAPEAGVLGAGVVGGLGLGAAGAALGGGNPLAVFSGTVGGEALGEGAGQFVRLMEAAERGLIDPTPNEILRASVGRGGEAAILGGASGAAFATARRLLASRLGVDADVIQALGDRPISEITAQARGVQRQVQQETGKEFPLTLGQQTGNPEVLKAEEAGMRRREVNAPIRAIEEAQTEALSELEQRTFGRTGTEQDRRELGQTMQAGAASRAARAGEQLDEATQRTFGRATTPSSGVASAREQIVRGREQVFAPLRKQFDDLQRESGVSINLRPVRDEAMRMSSEEGQNIMRSVGVHARSRLLREASEAGLEVTEDAQGGLVLTERNVSLGEVQRALRDIRAELRRPGIADDPIKKRVLTRVQDALVKSRDDSLPATDRLRVHMLEEQYKERMNTLERDIVGEFMARDPATGAYRLTSQDAVRKLLRDPESASAFVTSLDSIPTGAAAKTRMRDSVLGYIEETYMDPATGQVDPARLKGFLRNRSNRESLKALFADRPQILKSLDDTQRFAQKLKDRTKVLEQSKERLDRTFGLSTVDPAEIVSKFMNESNAQGMRKARRLLPEDYRPVFDRVLQDNLRQRMVNSEGALDAGQIDAFLKSDQAHIASTMFGADYLRNLGIMRDALRTTTQTPGRGAAGDLAQYFSRDVNALQGLMRFTRVPFAPLSVQGRAFTASVGVLQDRARRRMADLIANPKDLRELARLTNVSPRTRRAEIILGRLGLESYLLARDEFYDTQEGRDRGTQMSSPIDAP